MLTEQNIMGGPPPKMIFFFYRKHQHLMWKIWLFCRRRNFDNWWNQFPLCFWLRSGHLLIPMKKCLAFLGGVKRFLWCLFIISLYNFCGQFLQRYQCQPTNFRKILQEAFYKKQIIYSRQRPVAKYGNRHLTAGENFNCSLFNDAYKGV